MKSRRSVLLALASGATVAAGCSSLGTSQIKFKAGGLRVRNEHSLPHLIDVTIIDETSGLDPIESHPEFHLDPETADVYPDVFVAGTGYTVEAVSGEEAREFGFRYEQNAEGPDGVELLIKDDGTLTARQMSTQALR